VNSSDVQPVFASSSPLSELFPPGIIRRYGHDLATIQKLSDAFAAPCLLWLLESSIRGSTSSQSLALGKLGAVTLVLTLSSFGVYRSFRERSIWSLIGRLVMAWAALMGLVAIGLFLLGMGASFSRVILFSWAVLLLAWLLCSHVLSRYCLRHLRVRGQNSRRDGYIGSDEGFRHLYERLSRDTWRGHALWPVLTWPRGACPQAADLCSIQQLSHSGDIDQWIVEDTGQPDVLAMVLAELEQHTCPVLLIPSWLQNRHGRPQPCQVAGMPALQLWSTEATPLKLRLKHLGDLLVSFVLLVFLAPFLLLLALLVCLDSSGPALFRQRRYGINGKPFFCFKFRTMRVMEDGDVVTQVTRHDRRVTKVGSVLRRLNLDELPQLINVLRGEMSLVGPRPHAEAHNEYYRSRVNGYMRRHTLRPGITGWAQVLGLRGETQTLEAMDQRVRADLDYIYNWSLLLDLEILLRTLIHWSDRNAY
jgi:putative colanic acid biosynthesis UDP-glucose lipid carrier transferase